MHTQIECSNARSVQYAAEIFATPSKLERQEGQAVRAAKQNCVQVIERRGPDKINVNLQLLLARKWEGQLSALLVPNHQPSTATNNGACGLVWPHSTR